MDLPLPCCGSMADAGTSDTPLYALNDGEGVALPKALPPLIGADGHLGTDVP